MISPQLGRLISWLSPAIPISSLTPQMPKHPHQLNNHNLHSKCICWMCQFKRTKVLGNIWIIQIVSKLLLQWLHQYYHLSAFPLLHLRLQAVASKNNLQQYIMLNLLIQVLFQGYFSQERIPAEEGYFHRHLYHHRTCRLMHFNQIWLWTIIVLFLMETIVIWLLIKIII